MAIVSLPVSAGDTALATQYNNSRLDAIRAGRTFVVAPSGGDYATIALAMAAASEGDTIYVKSGTYSSVGAITCKSGVTLIGENKTNTILDGVMLDIVGTFRGNSGTITLTNADATVTGDASQFSTDSVAAGDILCVPSLGLTIEVSSVTNETALELVSPFEGETIATLSYYIINAHKNILIENFTFQDDNSTLGVIELENCTNITIRNNIFDPTGASSDDFVQSNTESSNILIENNLIKNGQYGADFTSNDFNISFINNTVINCNRGFSAGGTSSNVIVSNNIINGCDIGIYTIGTAIVSNNIINGSDGQGILVGGNSNVISGNIVLKSGSRGMDLSGVSDSSIINNIVKESKLEGIHLSTCNQNVISGNVCNDNTTEGIELTTCDNNILTSNQCNNNSGTGILIDNAAADKNVVGNNIALNNTTANFTDNGTSTSSSNNITA